MKKGEFPKEPGVYIFKDKNGKVLYVGKAVNLRARLRSYFGSSGDSRFLYPFLVEKIEDVEWIVTDTEKEALLLEERLIKKLKPLYNVKLRDDKTYVNLRINVAHRFPGVWIERRPLKDGNLILGPFSSVKSLREFLDIALKAFRLRTCSDREMERRTRPCIEYEMKRCSAPCMKFITEEEYRENLQGFVNLFTGKGKEVIEDLRKKMMEFSEREEFEKAARVRDMIRAIERTLEKERIYFGSEEDRDFIGVAIKEKRLCISVVSVRNGALDEIHNFSFRKTPDPREEISLFILQFYRTRKYIPPAIILRSLPEEAGILEEILSERATRKVRLLSPSSEKEEDFLSLAEKNAEAGVEKERKREFAIEKVLMELKERFRLSNFPARIECFDVSNLFGMDAGGARVTFFYGEPLKNEYRRYKIERMGIDDYGMLYEIIRRRIRDGKERGDLPDLIVIDGGKGHLGVGLKALKDEGVSNIDVISIAKGRRRRRGKRGDTDMVFIPLLKEGIPISPDSRVGRLLMRIRDEAHRFAIGYHRKIKERGFTESLLLRLPGIGEKRARLLLSRYMGIDGILEAPSGEIARLLRMNISKVEEIKKALADGRKSSDEPEG